MILAQAASTDSSINRTRFGGADFAPAASFDLMSRAQGYTAMTELGLEVATS